MQTVIELGHKEPSNGMEKVENKFDVIIKREDLNAWRKDMVVIVVDFELIGPYISSGCEKYHLL